jgi:hypothetical protein
MVPAAFHVKVTEVRGLQHLPPARFIAMQGRAIKPIVFQLLDSSESNSKVSAQKDSNGDGVRAVDTTTANAGWGIFECLYLGAILSVTWGT